MTYKPKKFADTVTLGAGVMFIIKAAVQGVVGWIAAEWFKRLLSKFRRGNDKQPDHGVSSKESQEDT